MATMSENAALEKMQSALNAVRNPASGSVVLWWQQSSNKSRLITSENVGLPSLKLLIVWPGRDYPKRLDHDAGKDLRSILSDAFSSSRLQSLVAPVLDARLSSAFKGMTREDCVEQAVDLLAQAIKHGLTAPIDEAARLAALPKRGELPTWAGREAAGLGHLNPVDFYRTVWKDFQDSIYLDELNERDEKLSRAIRAFCSRNPNVEAKDVLPPPGHTRTSAVASQLQSEAMRAAVRIEDRKRKAAQKAANKHRQAIAPR